jgi:hypothetical protein
MWTVRFVKNGGRRPLHRGRLYHFPNLPVLSVIRRKKIPILPVAAPHSYARGRRRSRPHPGRR